METRLTVTSQFISDGHDMGYEGERLEKYVKERKAEYDRDKEVAKAEEEARFERQEKLKKEAKAEEEARKKEAKAEEEARKKEEEERFERDEKAKREEHERWKERDAKESIKRKEELELARLKEKSAPEAGGAAGQSGDVRYKNVLDRLDKSFQGMKDDDDLLAYLTHFEAVAARCKIERKEWSLLLSYKLTTALRNFMLRDSLFLSENYEEVKTALLRHADINAETCRKRFHLVRPSQNDFRRYVTELRTALDNWCKMAEVGKTVEELKDLLIKDRILESVSSDIYRQLVLSKHRTVDNMLEVIEGFKVAGSDVSICKEESAYVAAACREPVRNRSPGIESNLIICFKCKRGGHKASECPQRSQLNSSPASDVRYRNTPTISTNTQRPSRNASQGRYQRQFDGNGRRIRGNSVGRQSYATYENSYNNRHSRTGGTWAYQNRDQGPGGSYR
ncbi:uncharacterized protein LOC129925320 isoform X1 [Biomphalaria glabrata]|uniref:Uncharacterized protein LOC129925320 isoform X1 n=1 Tax=Biomphalaria glabrata TaxID=6526 RepID=A0A9W3A186_BIOGL|nr:uncharacterized protein LOC129925320 isoform X1 [Biomphalaria glabrata]